MERHKEILKYWFENLDEDTLLTQESPLVKKWFGKDKKVEQELKKFEPDIKKAAKGEYAEWENDAYGRLALILLYDQFPRHLYRDTPKAYQYDLKALELALRSVKDEFEGRVYFVERLFYFLPLLHAENMEVQTTSVEMFGKLLEEAERYEDQNVPFLKEMLVKAQRHLEIYQRFGRFPDRNRALDRKATSEEREFAEDPMNQLLIS